MKLPQVRKAELSYNFAYVRVNIIFNKEPLGTIV